MVISHNPDSDFLHILLVVCGGTGSVVGRTLPFRHPIWQLPAVARRGWAEHGRTAKWLQPMQATIQFIEQH